jgi:uncharacterized membrane protein HdeD (DUF308 family)
MLRHDSGAERSWWKVTLTGFLALVFGIAAVFFPANIMFGRILDVIFAGCAPQKFGTAEFVIANRT